MLQTYTVLKMLRFQLWSPQMPRIGIIHYKPVYLDEQAMVSSFNFTSNHPSDKYITIHQRQIEIMGLPYQNPLRGDPFRICFANRPEPGTRLRIAREILLMKLYSAQHRIYKKLSPYLHRQTSDPLSVSISHTYYICNYTCISPRSPRTG